MGLFGKKKYAKNVASDNAFLKNFAIKINGLMRYAEENENVTLKLKKLQEDFQYTVATQVRDAKEHEVCIEAKYEVLKKLLQTPGWEEKQVIAAINDIGIEIDELNSLRR